MEAALPPAARVNSGVGVGLVWALPPAAAHEHCGLGVTTGENQGTPGASPHS